MTQIHTKNWHLQQLLIFIGLMLCSVFIGSFIGLSVGAMFYDFDIKIFQQVITEGGTNSHDRIALLTTNISTFMVMFVMIPYFYIKYTKYPVRLFSNGANWNSLYCIPVVFFLSLPILAFTLQWNQQMVLPDFMSEIEKWMKESERQAEILTKFMIDFQSPNEFILGLIAVAVMPAIGEELVFRGVLQRQLHNIFKNPHFAIIVTAIIFSAVHRQFYGFIPRMLLGAIFGYLFYWSGNFWYAVLAHFINNASQLFMSYFLDKEVDEAAQLPFIYFLGAVLLMILTLLYFKKINLNQHRYEK